MFKMKALELVVPLLLAKSRGATIEIPRSVPNNASEILDRSYLGLAIEGRDFTNYTGSSSAPNRFSINMFSTFFNITGATTGNKGSDNFYYDPNQAEAITTVQPELANNERSERRLHAPFTIGKAWLDGLRVLPNVKWDFQIPLARANLSNAVLFCRDSLAAMGDAFNSFEFGNEPDLYNATGPAEGVNDRPDSYGPKDYVQEYNEWTAAIAGNLSLSGSQFQALALSNFAADPWSEEIAFNAGLAKEKTKSISEHYYQSRSGRSLQGTLMNHRETVTQSDRRFKDRIQYMKRAHPDIPFVIGEAAASLGNNSGIPDYDLAASLGTALWTIDWILYTMTLGAKRVNMQLGTRFAFSPWQPIEATIGGRLRPAQTLGSFYGNVFVAELIGREKDLQVAEFGSGDQDVVGYGAYNSGVLSKVALVDLQLWRRSFMTPRPNVTVTLTGLDAQRVRVEKLTGPDGGAQAEEIRWAGKQWTAQSEGLPVVVGGGSESVEVRGGSVDVLIQASEALLLSLL
ncbi:hypothetical protein IWZ01DRAFT_560892 [Phyllosticta capitalensis]